MIQRNLPGIGSLNREQLKEAAATFNGALAKMAGKGQRQQSFLAAGKTIWIYIVLTRGPL